MADLNADIASAIKNHLPQAVGEQLRQRLEAADRADRNVVDLRAEVASLKDRLAKYADIENREALLAARAADNHATLQEIERRERDLDRDNAMLRAQEAERRADGIFRLAEIALGRRSITERLTVHGRRDMPVTNNGYTSTQQFDESHTTERDIESIG